MTPDQERGLEHMQFHGASGGGPDPDCDFCRDDERQAGGDTHWWAISDDAFRSLLERAYDGEDPELLLMEQYANSDTENVDG